MRVSRFSITLAAAVLMSIAACSYYNGRGDAEEFARRFVADNFVGAHDVSTQCQGRDTDDNGYVTCSVTVQWDKDDSRREMIPLECAVNRVGSGCSNEGCRPLATFGRSGGR